MGQVISFSVVTFLCALATFAHDEERLSPNLTAAPAPLGDRFVGREPEFAKLDAAWTAGKIRTVGVVAWGGFGKSAMVRQWLYRHETGWPGGAEPDGIFWYTVQLKTDTRFLYTEVMNYFYRSGQQVAGEEAPIKDKLAALKFAIGDRRAIVVLDGLEPLQIADRNGRYGAARNPLLRELLRAFCRGELGNVMCVVTSRLPLADLAEFSGKTYAAFNLEERLLTDDEANLLLKLEGVKAGSGEQKARLIAFCHHHPLALKIVANLLKTKAGGDAAKWDELIQSQHGPAEPPRTARVSVRIVLDILRHHLDADATTTVQLLARVSRPMSASFLRLLAEDEWPLPDFDVRRFDATLDLLVKLRVVDYNEQTRTYALHPLVAEYFGGPPSKTGLKP